MKLLDSAAKRLQNSEPASREAGRGRCGGARGVDEEVEIPSRGVRLEGQLPLPVPAGAS